MYLTKRIFGRKVSKEAGCQNKSNKGLLKIRQVKGALELLFRMMKLSRRTNRCPYMLHLGPSLI